ncbi:hypothetical protein LN042_23855 [Kitasatospora sp. RB6PN24]|uniref:hypothetical protein n=1 Tax=Kitasatospora humi TaxID=2893891 RepID=UPI001E4CA036|nr:hypothetical protein [Kitasatospora humi]MCC9310066.1 hypothetical protein [Kitasatospora humi]
MTTFIATAPPARRDPDLALVQASTAAAATWIGELAERQPLRHADSYRDLAEAIRAVG